MGNSHLNVETGVLDLPGTRLHSSSDFSPAQPTPPHSVAQVQVSPQAAESSAAQGQKDLVYTNEE